MAGFFDTLFGTGKGNPSTTAQPYYNQIPGQAGQYVQPYHEFGKAALPDIQGQYKTLLDDPGGKLNKIGESFHESPGFKFAMEQALNAAGRSAAAGGMAGSPQHQQYAMELATNLGNQDYYNYLTGATGLYNKGLDTARGMAEGGLNAGKSLADIISQTLAQQGNLAYAGQNQKTQNMRDLAGNAFKGIGSAFSAFSPFSGIGALFGGGS
jgi:hypothetical protein